MVYFISDMSILGMLQYCKGISDTDHYSATPISTNFEQFIGIKDKQIFDTQLCNLPGSFFLCMMWKSNQI